MYRIVISIFITFGFLSQKTFAGDEVINQLRFYYGQSAIDPKEVNDAVDAAGFTKFTKFNHYAIEASRDIIPRLNMGLRLGMRSAPSKTKVGDNTGTFAASILQSSALLMITSPFFKTDKFKAEIFTGLGGGTTSYSIKNATDDGKLSDGQTLPIGILGGAVAVGYKYVFLKLEAGYEYNQATNLKETGTVSGNVEKLDLSGPYFNIGIMIDGLALGRL